MARPGWRCLGAASGQLLSPALCPSFLLWHSPSHTPDPGFSGPVAATEASQMSPGEEPFALLCSSPHPEPSDRGEAGLEGPSRLQLWHRSCAAARGVQLLLFQCLFPPCPADPLETGSVFGLGEGPSAAQPGLGVLQAPGGSDPSPCSAQPGCARAAIPALPHPHPRVRRARVGFAVGLSTTALTPIPSSCPGFGLCLRVNPSRSFPS